MIALPGDNIDDEPLGVRARPVTRVDTEEMEEASESFPLLNTDVKAVVVVSDLFFLGISGSTRPGSSLRSRL